MKGTLVAGLLQAEGLESPAELSTCGVLRQHLAPPTRPLWGHSTCRETEAPCGVGPEAGALPQHPDPCCRSWRQSSTGLAGSPAPGFGHACKPL